MNLDINYAKQNWLRISVVCIMNGTVCSQIRLEKKIFIRMADYREVCITMQMSTVNEATLWVIAEQGLYLEHETGEDINMQNQHLSTPAEGGRVREVQHAGLLAV